MFCVRPYRLILAVSGFLLPALVCLTIVAQRRSDMAQHALVSVKVDAGELNVQALVDHGHISELVVHDGNSGRDLRLPEAFSILFSDGTQVDASKLVATPMPADAKVYDPHQSLRAGAKSETRQTACWSFAVPEHAMNLQWCLIARAGTHYARELLRIDATSADVPLTEVRMLAFADSGAKVDGTVKGSPIVDRTLFFGLEHPLSTSSVKEGQARASLLRTLPLRTGQSITYSAVIGTTPEGQMRRRFLEYLEDERPRRYEPFLHYNSWYDLGYGNRFDEAGVLDRIHAFGEELTVKRHVKMDSFLLDDGWDDTHNLWALDQGFPHGLGASAKAASAYGFGIGLWLSPWGGYGNEKLERVAYGREHGYEILNDGYALSGPKYFERFQSTCEEMIRKYNVNQFKFDGTGNADRVFPGSAFDSDFDAAIHLIEDLRHQKRDLFINLTTGTTASPFWVFYADSIWRGGEDHDFTGVGSDRQRWITYRDAQTYKNIVLQGPLFPLNSLMLHGIVYAQQAEKLKTDPKNDFADEVHSYFGTGTQTQELYITPSLLSSSNWDTLAAAANWSRAHREVLKDTHWLGGDPEKLEVYGWAAWSSKLAIVTLRNPSNKPQAFSLNAATAFELTATAPRHFELHNVWSSNDKLPSTRLNANEPFVVQLAPFEVLTFEATPIK
jgi:hypothetical protein